MEAAGLSEAESKLTVLHNFSSVAIVDWLQLLEGFLLAINDPECGKTGGYSGLLGSIGTMDRLLEVRETRPKSTSCAVSVTVVSVHDLCPSVRKYKSVEIPFLRKTLLVINDEDYEEGWWFLFTFVK